jgi:hypothetical protein
MVMGMNQKPKKSYQDKGPSAKEELERRNLIEGGHFEYDDDKDTITKSILSPFRGGKPKAGKIVSQKQITTPKGRRSNGLSNSKSASASGDLQTMRRQTQTMAEMEPEEKATPMENAVRKVRERKALRKSKSDSSGGVRFAMMGKSIQEQQDTSGPGLLSKHEDDNNNNNNNTILMGMNRKAKKSYLDKGPAKEQLERRSLIKGRLFEYDDDEDIDPFSIPTKRILSPFGGGKPKKGKTVSQKQSTSPKGRRSLGLSNTKSASGDLQPMRRQSRIMTEMEPEEKAEKATPMEKVFRLGRERKALGKSKSDASVLFAMGKSIQKQDTSGPADTFISRGLQVLENFYDDCN